jgi:sec-independent protein translocase protein TatB
MLDISFSELVVCFLVALVVLGPERMPALARALGRWTGKARTYMRNFTAELERETQISELKRQLDEAQSVLREHVQETERAAHSLRKEAQSALRPPEKEKSGEHDG